MFRNPSHRRCRSASAAPSLRECRAVRDTKKVYDTGAQIVLDTFSLPDVAVYLMVMLGGRGHLLNELDLTKYLLTGLPEQVAFSRTP